jgi:serine/threonine protein kinase
LAEEKGIDGADDGYSRCYVARDRRASTWIMDFSTFEKVIQLGVGSFGAVWLMENRSTKERYAVKEYRPGEKFDENVFRREIGVLFAIDHPCVLPIRAFSFPVGESVGAKVAADFLANGSLAHITARIDKGDIPDFWTHTNIATGIVSILLGLGYLHSKGICHGGLRPTNILVNQEGILLIGDFWSNRFQEIKAARQTFGVASPVYFAPETFKLTGDGPKVDVYAFGLILYEILFGMKAIPNPSDWPGAVQAAIDGSRREIPSWSPPWLTRLIEQCWELRWDERPAFDEAYKIIEANEFQFYPDVDVEVVRGFVERVREWETGRSSS